MAIGIPRSARNAAICSMMLLLATAAVWGQQPPTVQAADLNGDGRIDGQDVALVTMCMGRSLVAYPQCRVADLDADRAVTTADLQLVRPQYGRSGLPVAPSPQRLAADSDGMWTVKDEVVVVLRATVADPAAAIREIARSVGGTVIGGIEPLRLYQIQFTVANAAALENHRQALEQMADVQSAVLHYLSERGAARVPNDPIYTLFNTAFGLADSWSEVLPETQWHHVAVKTPDAWESTTGSPAIRVGIVDEDFDIHHVDLVANLRGWSGPATPGDGHGTHVAGLACGAGNNGVGITGVTWRCSLGVYDYRSPVNGLLDPVLVAQAMTRAILDGARVVNLSVGVVDNNQCGPGNIVTLQKVAAANAVLRQPIQFALDSHRDVLWVISAGNECRDAQFQSPASLVAQFPDNVVTVGAMTRSGNRAPYSNTGSLVSVWAPGGERAASGKFEPGDAITSTLPGNLYGEAAGTSMAAPIVTGIGTLFFSRHPNLPAAQAKACIVAGVTPSGLVSAPNAVACPMPLALSVKGAGKGTITSIPAGIACGSTCAHAFPLETTVRLTATPNADSQFAGWSGDCAAAAQSPTAIVIVTRASECAAQFDRLPPPPGHGRISVVVAGSGSIVSDNGTISCPSTCTTDLPIGTSLTLTATANAGYAFSSWSGDCAGQSRQISISIAAETRCTANFVFQETGSLDLILTAQHGNGSGVVVSVPAGIDCGPTCSTAGFVVGQSITLVATADAGSTFVRWSGDCTGTTPSVAVTVGRTTFCDAVFRNDNPVTIVGALNRLAGTQVSGINASGQVSGWDSIGDFIWTDGDLRYVDRVGPGVFKSLFNDAGQIAFSFHCNSFGCSPGRPAAFLWSAGTTQKINMEVAFGLNNRGSVVGSGNGGVGAFKWTNGALQSLGDFNAADINDGDEVVGSRCSPDCLAQNQAVMWHSGSGIQTIGGLSGYRYSYAVAINNARSRRGDVCCFINGHIAGYSSNDVQFFRSRGWLLQRTLNGSSLVNLGSLNSGSWSKPAALNDRDEVVGTDSLEDASNPMFPRFFPRAFIWDGQMHDLNAWVEPSLGWSLQSAVAINNASVVVGNGTGRRGNVFYPLPFLLDTVPKLTVTGHSTLSDGTPYVTLRGTGFPPHAEVTVWFIQREGGTFAGGTLPKADSNGSFETAMFFAFPNANGVYETYAVDGVVKRSTVHSFLTIPVGTP